MKGWQAVTGEISSVEFHSGSSRTAKYGVAHRVVAAYRYSVDGVGYMGDRIGVQPSGYSDSVGDYHQRMYGELLRARRAGEVLVWVNPDDPSESVLDREIRWEVVRFLGGFGLVFAFGGGAFVLVGLRRFSDPSFLKPG
jgi:hypothetical protein